VSFFFFIYNEMVSEQTICMISFLPAKTVCCYIVQFLRRMKETIIHAIKLIMLWLLSDHKHGYRQILNSLVFSSTSSYC
jgi:hypothetical protein